METRHKKSNMLTEWPPYMRKVTARRMPGSNSAAPFWGQSLELELMYGGMCTRSDGNHRRIASIGGSEPRLDVYIGPSEVRRYLDFTNDIPDGEYHDIAWTSPGRGTLLLAFRDIDETDMAQKRRADMDYSDWVNIACEHSSNTRVGHATYPATEHMAIRANISCPGHDVPNERRRVTGLN